jgi:hypothetical protein
MGFDKAALELSRNICRKRSELIPNMVLKRDEDRKDRRNCRLITSRHACGGFSKETKPFGDDLDGLPVIVAKGFIVKAMDQRVSIDCISVQESTLWRVDVSTTPQSKKPESTYQA